MLHRFAVAAATSLLLTACLSEEPEGLRSIEPAAVTVQYDWYAQPLPVIPLPNDVATRFDETSPTGRRLNASLMAPTFMEQSTRGLFDELDGWGVYAPITIPFTEDIDVRSVRAGHCRFDADDVSKTFCKFEPDMTDDVVYLVDVTRDSPDFGRAYHLDIGHGNFPAVAEEINGYWGSDPRGDTLSILFDETDEDVNQNGRMDPGEDTDLDGVFDRGNYLPGHFPAHDDKRARADALMTFYERESHTLIVRPLMPLREHTTYAVVVTKRINDLDGQPIGSPFPWINHASQTEALRPLLDVLPAGLSADEIAFTFSFTTGSVEADWKAVRDGLYGFGVQQHLATEFPAEVKSLFEIRQGVDQPYVMYSEEWIEAAQVVLAAFFGGDTSKRETQALLESQRYIDFHAVGTYVSPQLFERTDARGEPLGLNQQSWPNDLTFAPAKARSEDVHFWLTVPRKEVSARGQGKPVPVAILIHGYGSQRFEALQFGGFFAKHGVATLAIDCVSHGIGLGAVEKETAITIMDSFGLKTFMEATLTDRAFDQNGDGIKDSGADFWTAYIFHTRDVVRQSGLDYMQLVRILRTFDGQTRWGFDSNGDGTPDLAGDFDGDGVVDIAVGPDQPLSLVGGSLGGIMSSVLGGIEPEVDVIIPISGGGGLADVGIRSLQGGVREAVILRIMGPVYIGALDAATGTLALQTTVPDLNDVSQVPLGTLSDARIGDTLVARNLVNGEHSCGLISPEGTVRVHLESDVGDETVLELYRGLAIVNGSGDCELRDDTELVATFDSFGVDATFQGETIAAGAPLVALAEGMGRYRAQPGLRRMLSLAQVALDRADPAVHAPFFQDRPVHFDGTGEVGGTHALVVTTIGDMNVPASTGVSIARAAGYVDFLGVDGRYGETPNQVLIDTQVYEAVDWLSRWTNGAGTPVHLDVENLSAGTDMWGDDNPRLDPPLRLFGPDTHCDDGGCGISGALFPFPKPDGQHGFAMPGALTDSSVARCEAQCAEGGDDPCGCRSHPWFDVGHFMFSVLGKYMASGGKELNLDPCHSFGTCTGIQPPPASRPMNELR